MPSAQTKMFRVASAAQVLECSGCSGPCTGPWQVEITENSLFKIAYLRYENLIKTKIKSRWSCKFTQKSSWRTSKMACSC